MKIGIIGGALQGMEAVYLAKKAGYQTIVVDKRAGAPACSLADESVIIDPTVNVAETKRAISDCDMVLPANENTGLLKAITKIVNDLGVPLLFDMSAYDVSSSKIISNKVMSDLGVPMPLPWPECGFPAIVKPSSFSGSKGFGVVNTESEIDSHRKQIRDLGDDVVIQEFVSGKSISIETIGNRSGATSFITTEVILDAGYDCKMVRCNPGIVTDEVASEFGEIGRKIAEHMNLNGIMDVEAILHEGVPKILEIDARIPSQTPAAVLHATGINLVEKLVESKNDRTISVGKRFGRSSIYEHLTFDNGILYTNGENGFASVVSPHIEKGFFGCDEAITDYVPGNKKWRGTFMTSGSSPEEVDSKREAYITRMIEELDVRSFIDGAPELV